MKSFSASFKPWISLNFISVGYLTSFMSVLILWHISGNVVSSVFQYTVLFVNKCPNSWQFLSISINLSAEPVCVVYELRLQLNIINYVNYVIQHLEYLFFVGLYLMDMLSIVNVFHCGFGNGVSSQEDDQYASIFVYHVTRFIFVSLQLFLLQFLIGAKVRRSGYYQFAVKVLCMHVIVTNVTIWLTKFCQETGLFGGNNPSGEYDSLNCTLNIGDTFYDVTKRMDHILGPFVLEFCLISVGLFYTLYPLLRDTQMIGKSAAASSGYGGYKYKAVNIIKDATKSYRSMPSLILGCFFALLLVVSAWNLKNIDNRIQNLRFSFMVQIIVFLLILLFCRLTLHQLKEHHRQEQHDQTYNVEDVLLILSGPLGFLPFSLLVLFASFAYKEDDNHLNDFTSANQTEIRVWSALWAIASVVSVFVQTHFLIVGRHFKRDVVEERTRRSTEDISDDTHYISRVFSAGKINQFIIVLSMCNFGIWFMESFFEVDTTLLLPDEYSPFDIVQEFSPFVIPREYWGYNAWNIIKKLLYPFLIFYRLHCVAIMIHIWRKFQIKH